ncbi:MAG: hypothetical protein J6L71_05620 [Clostridia bacterium]|nr:hypothetical protein [Clostridia bacterium]
MKILRLCVLSLFIVVLIISVIFHFQQMRVDKTVPTITVEGDVLEVSLDVTNEELLKGVSAHDEKDGDISDKVIVESISRFTSPGVSLVRYAVCDNDNHVAFATRTIIYSNYTAPRFNLTDSLVFSISQNINIRDILGAVDSIDGDISDKVIITANDYTANIPGVYYISAKVANSKGDIITHQFPVYVEERSLSAPQIELEKYIAYLEVGEDFDIEGNILSALGTGGENLLEQINIDTNFNPQEAGVYEAHYRVTDSAGRVGHKIVFLFVE